MKNSLEEYVNLKIQKLDPKARRTKGSGNATELADNLNKYFYTECKMRTTKNCTIDRKVMEKLLSQRANNKKWCIYALENQFKDRYIVMEAEEFFQLIERGVENET